ncbi:hypothetical protein [Neobacillus sp. SuZ13]|uniref:hypothetical protein n=1 Tax=Neobacillus sp. SuZ13 TaxID=3047875 RepID=UPI0024C0736C|nr:hypothetical protein [Neobacillus sp. SuZ13]WHY65636.1 hypothetical protein QNH17_21470 [Neobacillus sp. SuZ13]
MSGYKITTTPKFDDLNTINDIEVRALVSYLLSNPEDYFKLHTGDKDLYEKVTKFIEVKKEPIK